MAIPWIHIDTTLPNKPVVMLVKRTVKCSANEAIGLIVRVLCWADGITADGVCKGYCLEDLDEHFGATGLAEGLVNAGWIYQNEDGWVAFKNYDNHMSECAKKRDEDRLRKSKSRENQKAKSKQESVTEMSQKNVTDVTKTCDQIRIDKKYKSANALNAGARACEDFSLLDNLREAWPKGAKATAKLKQTWREVLAEGVTQDELMACFERQRISNQWQQEYPRYVPPLQKWLDERGFKEELRILRSARKKAQESRAEQLGEEDYPELSQSDLNSVFD